MTQLEFSGPWPLGWLIWVSLALSTVTFLLYHRETHSREDSLRWFLPLLRSWAVFLITMMISGPRLHHKKIVGQLGRIIICIDDSQSMLLSDSDLEPHRKFLVLRSRGLIARSATPNFELSNAAEHLASAATIAGQAKPEMRRSDLQEITAQVVAALEKSVAVLKTTGGEGLPKARGRQKQHLDGLLQRLRSVANPSLEPPDWAAALNTFAAELSHQESFLREEYASASANAITELDPASQTAYQRFSESARWARAESLLLDPLTGLLRPLASHHMIEVRMLNGNGSTSFWHSDNPAKEPAAFPETFDTSPTRATTDLGSALKDLVLEKRGNQRTAVVLFSDGQHNDGPSPLESAKALGKAQMPLYAVGFGSTNKPSNITPSPIRPEQSLTHSLERLDRTKELGEGTCNEPLLREMASLSGGMYLREEDAGRLVRLLEPLSQGRVVESETVLWQSWWWFGTIMLLFALEWTLRKRVGLL